MVLLYFNWKYNRMSLNILVVDDSKLTRKIYEDKFNEKGHNVVLAENGQDGIEKYNTKFNQTENIASGNCDCVILDFEMPDIDGDKVASKILEINPLQKIVVISGSEVEKLRKAFQEMKNVVEIVQKGFSIDAFVKKIETGEEK